MLGSVDNILVWIVVQTNREKIHVLEVTVSNVPQLLLKSLSKVRINNPRKKTMMWVLILKKFAALVSFLVIDYEREIANIHMIVIWPLLTINYREAKLLVRGLRICRDIRYLTGRSRVMDLQFVGEFVTIIVTFSKIHISTVIGRIRLKTIGIESSWQEE